jgi:hypothetical protein
LGAAYGIFLFTHVPVAVAINEAIAAKPNEFFRLKGLADGRLITINLRGSGSATISAPGASLTKPGSGTLALLAKQVDGFQPSVGGVELRVTNNDESSLATITVAVAGNGRDTPTVDVWRRILAEGNGLTLTPSGGSLRAAVTWTSAPSIAPEAGIMLKGNGVPLLPIPGATVEVPAGVPLFIGAPDANLRVDFGRFAKRQDLGGADVRGLEVRSGDGGAPTLLACGKKEGQLQPGLTGEIATKACDSVLHLRDFRLDDAAHFQLSGSGFLMKDGAVRYWQLMSNLAGNLVLQAAFTTILAFLTAWAAYAVGFRKPKEQ